MQSHATIRNTRKQEATMSADKEEQLLTIMQLAEKLQVTRETIRRMRKAGKIKEYKIGDSVRFKLSQVLGESPENKQE
jgi:excisionase family DNA binding protein